MATRVFLRGNEAVAEGAIRAGCRFYAGYPITPQTEMLEYFSMRLPQVGGVFIQCESEVAGINYVFGAASTGFRALTSSSGLGMSLMSEGISCIAAAQVPCVTVNVMRAGPGIGRIAPAQQDYLQATKGGGHGDYKQIVIAPSTVQEMAEEGYHAFDIAERYRIPVCILSDGYLGQMAEPVSFEEMPWKDNPEKDWAITGAKNGRERRLIFPTGVTDEGLYEINMQLLAKHKLIQEKEQRWEEMYAQDAEIIVVAFGLCARLIKPAIIEARKEDIPVGLIRPISLWPFPVKPFETLIKNRKVKIFLNVEMNQGQMLEDVRLAVGGDSNIVHYPVYMYGLPEEKKFTWKQIYNSICDVSKQL